MMRALFLVCFLLPLVVPCSGQADSLPPFPTPEWRLSRNPKVGTIGELTVNSSGLTTEFYRPFVQGGHIDDDLKKRTMEGMEKVNRFGGNRLFSVGGSFEPDSLFGTANEERTLFFRGIDGRYYHARFRRDLFRTIFIGNADREERLELAPFRLNSMRYRQLKVGLLDRKGRFELGIAISAFQGISDLRIEASEAYLGGEDPRSELRFRMKGAVFRQGRREKASFWEFRGSGIGVDIMSGYELGKYGRVQASIRDMGLFHWGPNARVQRIDTNVRFEGFSLQDPLGKGDVGSNASMDSLEDRYLPEEKGNAYRHLFPGSIRFAYMKKFPSGFWFRSSFLHRPFTPYVPFVELEVMKGWNRFRGGLSAGYGGFGELAFGLQAAYRFGERWDLYLRIPHLEGIVAPKSMGGVGASAGLHYSY